MANYRLYTSDGPSDGHFLDVEQIDAPDDETAMQMAGLNGGEFLELWQEGRRVSAFKFDRPKARFEELQPLLLAHARAAEIHSHRAFTQTPIERPTHGE